MLSSNLVERIPERFSLQVRSSESELKLDISDFTAVDIKLVPLPIGATAVAGTVAVTVVRPEPLIRIGAVA